MRPRVGSYVDTSTSTTSPGRTRMPRPRRMRPDGLASSWKPLSNSTSKVESGSIFTTVPRIRTYSSVSLANVLLLHSLQTLKLPQAIRVGPLPDESPGEAGGRYRPRKRTWGERCDAPDESPGVAGGRYRHRKRTWGERCDAPDESPGEAGGRYRHRSGAEVGVGGKQTIIFRHTCPGWSSTTTPRSGSVSPSGPPSVGATPPPI